MAAVDNELIVAAIEEMAVQAGDEGLVKKPNVADVEAVLGSDITAPERDAAWDVFTAKALSGSVDSAEADAEKKRIEDAKAEELAAAEAAEKERVAAEQAEQARKAAANVDPVVEANKAAVAAQAKVAELRSEQQRDQMQAARDRTKQAAEDAAATAELAKIEKREAAEAAEKSIAQKAADLIKDYPVVTNNHTSALCIANVVIQPKQSKPVGALNMRKSLVKAWIAAGVISVKMPS